MSRALTLFKTLQADPGPTEVSALRRAVRTHLDDLVRQQARSELIAIDLAELLCLRLESLLDASPSMGAVERAMVVGAARYFISDEDARPDAASATGLDDDVEVFNHVASNIGRADLLITEE